MLQRQPSQSPIPLVVLALTIVGVVLDYRPKKAGGHRPRLTEFFFVRGPRDSRIHCLGGHHKPRNRWHDDRPAGDISVVRLGSRPLENPAKVSASTEPAATATVTTKPNQMGQQRGVACGLR
jgi:hypothetical protein